MHGDPFDKLLDVPVPPPPENFDANLNDRVNRALTTEQLCDGLLRGLGTVAIELVTAICGGAFNSLERQKRDQKPDDKEV